MVINLIITIITGVIVLLAIKILMATFFEKRRTSILITIISYLLFDILIRLEAGFISIPLTNVLVPMVALFIITLNYESFMLKRLAVIGCFHLILN